VGARISVEFIIVPFTDDSGQMIGIAAIMRDVTARFEEVAPCAVSSLLAPPLTAWTAAIPSRDPLPEDP
jgi:hypothetical protein